jgi:hypothetical protein
MTVSEVEVEIFNFDCPGWIQRILDTGANGPAGEGAAILEEAVERIRYLDVAAE